MVKTRSNLDTSLPADVVEKHQKEYQNGTKLSYLDTWLSTNPDRREGEKFFLKWHCFWLLWFGGIVVLKTYENFNEWSYMKVGLLLSIPPILLPLVYPKISGEAHLPWHRRYTTKANIFIFIAAWVGNYGWTHYFYKVLGTSYTFPGLCLNGVPLPLTLITHSYFHLYHSMASMCIRPFWKKVASYSTPIRYTLCALLYVFMGYVTAVLEVVSIASFPYYDYPDTKRMWVIGSVFYGIYFLISYPYYTLIDEDRSDYWTPLRVCIDALAYCMITTLMLDAWRLIFGALNPPNEATLAVVQHAVCVPWW